jgi:hypothetical protein
MSKYIKTLAVATSVLSTHVAPPFSSTATAQQVIEITGQRECGSGQIRVNGWCQYPSGSGYSSGSSSGSGSSIPENEATLARGSGVLSDVCTSPAATESTKNTSSLSDITGRWLAASQLFTAQNLWNSSNLVTKGPIVFQGRTYQGYFTVTYSDGATEKWAVAVPLGSTATALVPDPLPGLTPPTKPAGSSCKPG